MAKKDAWAGFKPEGKLPDYSGDKLHKAWKELHAGDGEPYPDEKRAAALIKSAGKAAPKGVAAADLAGVAPRMDPVPAVGEHTEAILDELGLRRGRRRPDMD